MTIETIDICICTYRRPELRLALQSVAAQVLPDGIRLRTIVADNDATDGRRDDIEGIGRDLSIALRYVHAPVQNISIARNACLDAAEADWMAFMDDDEVAAPDWIARLLARRSEADIVFGVSQASYPSQAPSWMVEGDFHSNRISGNDAAWNGYTANVLIDRRLVARHGLRFAPELGQVGGEDTMFFFDAHRAGARFTYAPDAVVHEGVPVPRARIAWLARRRYRAGQVHWMLGRKHGRGAGMAVAALAKCLISLATAAVMSVSRRRSASALLRATLHLGVVASAIGFAPYKEYGTR